MEVFVNLHKGNVLVPNDTYIYKFFIWKNGKRVPMDIKKKRHQNTQEIFKSILFAFLQENKLVSITYDITKFSEDSENYFGIKLENDLEQHFSIYCTCKSLAVLKSLDEFFTSKKENDFYEYAKKYMETENINRLTIRPAGANKSAIVQIHERKDKYCFGIYNQLGYYYRKLNNIIEEGDLKLICKLIREFIHLNLEKHYEVHYHYTSYQLFIRCNSNSYIEIIDSDLIREIEHARILDDLWLVNHGIIATMPLQEESITKKEELKRKKSLYLKNN